MTVVAAPVSAFVPAPRPAPRRPHLELVPPLGRRVDERPEVARARRLHPAAYRRRRLGVAVAALAVGAVAWSGLPTGAPAAPPAALAAAPAGVVHVVAPGDTVWSIARRLQPEGDVRPLVDRLVAAHGSAVLQPGDRLALAG